MTLMAAWYRLSLPWTSEMATPGRRPGLPKVPGSGRRRGSLDKQARTQITEKIAGDILRTYQKLGGAKWLLEWAEGNPGEFVRQCLSRLMPPMPRPDDADTVNNTQINVMSDRDAAIRVAYALAKGMHLTQPEPVVAEQQRPTEPEQQQPVEAEPPRPDLPVTEKERETQAALEQYPARGCWPPVPESKPEVTLATYRGTREEQRGYPSEEIRRPRLPRRR